MKYEMILALSKIDDIVYKTDIEDVYGWSITFYTRIKEYSITSTKTL